MVLQLPTGQATSAEEWNLRVDLAACYRLVALFGWDDLVGTHISARLPGREEFLINPYGMTFDEMTASSLVKVDRDGEILSETTYGVNGAGFVIHSAVHEARPDVACVIHLHGMDGRAVSATETGLLALDQASIFASADLAYHEYEGPAFDLGERERLAANLGDKNAMILRNHGTLAVGSSVGAAFRRIYHLERCCAVQIKCLSMGQPLHLPPADAIERSLSLVGMLATKSAELMWPAMLRRLDRVNPGYAA
jgi:ribulose-5-phosphate 4-epimerase/fuculose-1-phosphate aldolase